MVKIEDNQKCCGCEACVQKCPKHCITLVKDEEGFYYPKVNGMECIQCGLCEQVCLFGKTEPSVPLEKLYAYKSKDKENILRSSSGGAFTVLASSVLEEGGVVFGATFDADWNVRHICVDNMEDVPLLQGSKYVQSRIGNTYKQAESFLKAGRKVLFTGTPCQIRGLKSFLNKDYENLLAVDFICHGVPSPQVWQRYLKEMMENNAAVKAADGKNTVLSSSINLMSLINDIRFRDKTDGWEKYRFVVCGKSASKADKNSVLLSDMHKKNTFMKGFLSNVYLRPSCHACPAKKGHSGSDIQMGDFWGIKEINRSFYSKDGVSMLIAQSEKGDAVCRNMKGDLLPLCENVTLINQSYGQSSTPHPKRSDFFARYAQEAVIPLINEISKEPFKQRAYVWVRIFLKRIGVNHKLNKIVQRWRKK